MSDIYNRMMFKSKQASSPLTQKKDQFEGMQKHTRVNVQDLNDMGEIKTKGEQAYVSSISSNPQRSDTLKLAPKFNKLKGSLITETDYNDQTDANYVGALKDSYIKKGKSKEWENEKNWYKINTSGNLSDAKTNDADQVIDGKEKNSRKGRNWK
jgi:hypothetical protein